MNGKYPVPVTNGQYKSPKMNGQYTSTNKYVSNLNTYFILYNNMYYWGRYKLCE